MTILTLIPPAVPLSTVQSFIRDAYGFEGEWSALDGERDQNFRLKMADRSVVVKLCHPDEGDAALVCQIEALDHIASTDPGLPVPRVIRTATGETLPRLSHSGRDFPVLVLSWLDGDVLGQRVLSEKAHVEFGKLLARLGLAMRGFISGAPAGRRLIWDVNRAIMLWDQIDRIAPDIQPLARDILSRHRDVTMPALRHMRTQIIHGDVHPYNSLVDAELRISGIIDFGDIVHGALIFDLANAIADFLRPETDMALQIAWITKGYRSITPLEEAEADALVDLVETRLIMTPLIDAMKAAHGIAAQDYYNMVGDSALLKIRGLRDIGHDTLKRLIRRTAAYPAAPQRHPATLEDAVARRRKVMGEKLYVFYDPPLHIVKGEGVWLTASDGRRYLDCYNNVPTVGHCHPYVVEAIARQARTLNTNTRYITDQPVEYAERLTALSGPGLTSVIFVNSGSEANDLAWRMAKAWTGKRGALAMDFAYHGISESIDAFSPSNAPEHWNAPHIRLLPPPDTYRGPYGPHTEQAGEKYAALADPLIADLEAQGLGAAAVMVDSAFMTNGILDAPPGYLAGVVDRVRRAGGTFIADEVQSGFGRMGTAFWGHRHHGVTPDFITIGKPAGNGHPLGAVITRPEILTHFLKFGPFFSTFGGNNVACAAGIAVLDVIRDEDLVENARVVGSHFRQQLRALMDRHPVIGDVRGVGLGIGVELVKDRSTKEPAGDIVGRLLGLIRDEGVLIGGEGKLGNVLKIRPPIVFTQANADFAAAAIGRALSRL